MIGRLRQRRFRDIVSVQLRLFQQEHGMELHDARTELAAYGTGSDPVEAQEHYGRYDELCEDLESSLYDMCERYSQTLPLESVRWYVREFDRQARKAYRDVIPRLNLQRPQATDLGHDGPPYEPPLR